MKYAYCKILKCPKRSTMCYVKSCEYYVETDDIEEYHNVNRWRYERRYKGADDEIYKGGKNGKVISDDRN